MLIDCFFYNGEENLLEIHLSNLYDLVDAFVILESPRSHTQISRELEFPKQLLRFAKFIHKISYFPIDYCQDSTPLMNDWRGRRVIQDILNQRFFLNESSRILSGDLDEIISVDKLKSILDNDKELIKPYTFMMDNRILCFDLEPVEQPGKFPGTMLLRGKHLNEIGDLCHLRQIRANPTINGQKYNNFNIVMNGGWHFSYNSGIDRTVDKFRFYSHASETETWAKDKEGLINCIKTKTSFTPDKGKLKVIDWKEENFPTEIYNNPTKYAENLSNYYR